MFRYELVIIDDHQGKKKVFANFVVKKEKERCLATQDHAKLVYRPLAFGPVTRLGMRAKAPAVGKRDRGRWENDWSLSVVQLPLGIWDVSHYSEVLKFSPFIARIFVYRKPLGWVSVLPQNPSIAINIASSSCSRTVTTVFAGEVVELKSLLVLKKKKKDAGALWYVF